MKILILGNKEHGKTTLAEMLCKSNGLNYEDSSMAAARIFIYDKLKDQKNYSSFEECYFDRRNNRALWFNLIAEYNKEDETALAKKILEKNDIYVGMRRKEELNACRQQNLFDLIIGIYDPRKPMEESDSCTIDVFRDSDIVLINSGSLSDLEQKINLLNLDHVGESALVLSTLDAYMEAIYVRGKLIYQGEILCTNPENLSFMADMGKIYNFNHKNTDYKELNEIDNELVLKKQNFPTNLYQLKGTYT